MNSSKNNIWFWAFVLPALTFLILIIVLPFIMGLVYSVTDWNGVAAADGTKLSFVGLSHYKDILSDERFLRSFLFTSVFAVIAIVIINVLALGLALIVTQPLKYSNALRTIFFMPNLIGGLILGFIWQFIFISVFAQLGMPGWLSTTETGFWGIVILYTWQLSGYMMIIYIAYLQSISNEVIEATKIDGASPYQRFRYVIMPLIAPAFTVCMFMTLSNSFKLYDQNLSLTGGGPYHSTEMLAMNIYNTAFAENRMAYAQAKAVVFFVLVAFITLSQATYNKRKENNL